MHEGHEPDLLGDLLEPTLTNAEEAEVKKVCRELLGRLKAEKLILDWREKQ
jgi:type I restriction enzyme R subunit